jgi:hypothetical protein
MQNKTKILISVAGFLGVILFWLFLYYFHATGVNKEVELNLSQNNDEQKIVEESADNREEILDIPEKTVSIPEANGLGSQSGESKKDALVMDKLTTLEDTEKSKKNSLEIANRLVSWGFQEAKNRKIDTIIIHSSYDALGNDPYSVSGLIAEYKSYGVSPHYLIDRKGNVYRLVSDANIAYHAGESKMPDGRTGVNNFSLGIEMLTTKKDKLTGEQYSALKLLIASLKVKYKIMDVLGHNQIAPNRKDDPWNFEWNKLK